MVSETEDDAEFDDLMAGADRETRLQMHLLIAGMTMTAISVGLFVLACTLGMLAGFGKVDGETAVMVLVVSGATMMLAVGIRRVHEARRAGR